MATAPAAQFAPHLAWRTPVALASWLVGIGIACAPTVRPHQNYAAALGTVRACAAADAERVPSAALHLQLAQQGLEQALRSMQNGANHDAASALMRAQADADLALALAHEAHARAAAYDAVDHVQSSDQKPAF